MKKKDHFHLPAAALAIILCIAGCSNHQSGKNPPEAVKGLLDITSWNIDRDGPVMISGQWEFYWQKLLGPEDFSGNRAPAGTGYFDVPGIWNGYTTGGKKLTGDGFATFRVRILTGQGGLRSLRIPVMATAYRLYVNGALTASNGIVAETADADTPQYLPKTVSFLQTGTSIEIIMHISNFNSDKGGPWNSIQLGTQEQLLKERDKKLLYEYMLFGGLLIMALYHLGLFALRRNDSSLLFFGIYCLIIAIRITITGEFIFIQLFPDFGWETEMKFEFLTIFIGLPVFVLFIQSLYPFEMKAVVRRVYIFLGAAFSLPVLFTPVRVYSRLLLPFHVVGVITCLYLLFVAGLAIKRKREDAVPVFLGLTVLFGAIINDMLDAHIIIHTGYFLPSGLFIFVLLQSFILSRRSSKAFSDSLKLAPLRHELEIARRIQKSLLPSGSPALPGMKLHVLTLPPEGISGDFYNWHPIGEKRIGILIADIVGHGIPAALIASIMKVLFSLESGNADRPAKLLCAVNEMLLGQNLRHFITAAYACLDIEKRTITFANAGHPPGLIISEDDPEPREMKSSGRAMGWTRDLRCTEEVIELRGGDRILLYTDGIVDCRNPKGEIFGQERFIKAVCEWRSAPAAEFAQGLSSSLRQWRRPGTAFEDDITLLIIDITGEE